MTEENIILNLKSNYKNAHNGDSIINLTSLISEEDQCCRRPVDERSANRPQVKKKTPPDQLVTLDLIICEL